jgi:uncharacterized protein
MSTQLKVAVVTGGHPFDVPAFEQAFRTMPSVDFYLQSLDDFTYGPEKAAAYDVVVFYTMHRLRPGQELPWYQKNLFSTLETLGATPQGIIVLHHALVAFLEWPLWSELVGIADRASNYHFGEPVTTSIAAEHPITTGLEPWTMADETYTMNEPQTEDGNTALLTTDHPQSLKTLAWTRRFRKSRVFCYQSGHDARAFENASFRRVLERGILWAGNQI